MLVPGAVKVIMYSFGGNALPSWSAQPMRKLFPGPWLTPVGMQFGITMLLTTTGPQETPPHVVSASWGSITSTLPMLMLPTEFSFVRSRRPELGSHTIPPKPAGAMAPEQAPVGAVWLQNVPKFWSRMGPWWQGMV